MPRDRVRVLIGSVPELLRDVLLAALGADHQIETLQMPEDDDMADTLLRKLPDVLIARSVDAALLFELPRLQAFVLDSDASTVRLLRLQPVSDELGELTLIELLDLVKAHRGS